mmetsp:Transcript_41683/g.128559  ORF Transcript_41683/g.128559 Transcript_41683/m.128559 type:complete len:356 (+) Transcript_41683:2090-3157(+)
MLEGEHGLEQARTAGDGLEVADVGLDRADGDALAPRVRLLGGPLAEHVLERGQLDRVPDGRAGAVPLHHRHGGGVDASLLVRAPQRQLLAGDGGGVDAGRLAVGGGGAAADHRVHRVAVRERVLELLEHKHHRALADEHAVGRLVVGGDGLLVREDGRLGEGHVHADGAVGAGGARDHRAAVAVQKLVDGNLDRDERGGAGGVDDAVHPVQVEDVGAAARGHVAEEAGERVEPPLGEVRLVLGHRRLHVLLRHADLAEHLLDDDVVEAGVELVGRLLAAADAEHAADVLAHVARRVDARVLECLLDLEKRERLVCVRVLKLQHVEVELARLEGVVGDEAAARTVDLVRRVRVDRP